jgi:hypothetical protein
MDNSASVADAIAAKLTTRGLVPAGGVMAEITYVAIAKVTVFDVDGRPTVTYRPMDNLAGDEDARLAMAHRMVWEAERQAGKG